jgi:hypothetical protein
VRRNGAPKSGSHRHRHALGVRLPDALSISPPAFRWSPPKRVHFKSIAYELLWFLRGETNTKYLREHGVSIWDEWADENGELGPVYGKQWRSWPTRDGRHIDQISQVVEQLRSNPDSRRIIVSAWNVGELDQMKLMPCHAFFQFYVSDKRLSCQLYQRSADIFSASRSILPRMRCSLTCSRSSATSTWASSSGPAATAISIRIISNRWTSSSRAFRSRRRSWC